MEKVSPDQVLPEELQIESADNLLYRIGLSVEPNSESDSVKRDSFHRPLLILTICLLMLAKNTVNLLLSDQTSRDVFLVFGDFAHFIGIRVHYNINANIFTILPIVSQAVYYYNYRNGIKPTFLSVFEMMSGLSTPKSVGLTDVDEIMALIRITRTLLTIGRQLNEKVIPVICLILQITPYLIHGSYGMLIVFGIPNTLLFIAVAYHSFNIILYQVMYFAITCYYVRLRVNGLLSTAETLLERRGLYINIQLILRAMNRVCNSITEYNQTFWSKFLLCFWLIYGNIAVAYLYIVLYADLNLIARLIYVYFTANFFSMFLLVIFTASLVNAEVNKSYRIFNSFMVFTAYADKELYRYSADTKLKLNVLIERIAANKVGFSCWTVFTINYFRCAEIIGFLSVLFLKTVEFSI